MDEQGFIQIETPNLIKSTPEGARDYIVPSRVQPGKFFALPQSPQIFKQICMIAGFDKYYQIARCFRDEDLRADRQPEFSQLDVEISFATPEQIYKLVEGLFARIFKLIGAELQTPFPRLTFEEAMRRFGSDKPDLRIEGMELQDLSAALAETTFAPYASAMASGGEIKGIVVTLWVTDFPMFDFHEDDGRYYSMHHPFTSPLDEDVSLFQRAVNGETKLFAEIRAKAYDTVINGVEVAGGSIRIHRRDVQQLVFKALGMTEDTARARFGFFLEALAYGTPPHGGIASGIERVLMVLVPTENIRDVMAFPKTASAQDLMIDAPGEVDARQLTELHLKIVND